MPGGPYFWPKSQGSAGGPCLWRRSTTSTSASGRTCPPRYGDLPEPPDAGGRDRSGLLELILDSEGSCAGPFLSSVGRYEVLDGGAPGALVEITHATIHDGVGPVIEEHPDLEAERAPESFASDPRLRHSL